MSKTEIIAKVAEKAGVSKKVATDVVNAFISSVTDEIANGGSVQIIGFGTFAAKEKPARTCRNLRTGETFVSPAKKVPVFKPGSQLKETVKNGK